MKVLAEIGSDELAAILAMVAVLRPVCGHVYRVCRVAKGLEDIDFRRPGCVGWQEPERRPETFALRKLAAKDKGSTR